MDNKEDKAIFAQVKLIKKWAENLLQNLRNKFLFIKQLKILASIVVVLFLFILAAPLMLDKAGLKESIEKKMTEVYGVKFVINDGVQISFLPAPTIVIRDIYLQNYQPEIEKNIKGDKIYNFYCELTKIKFSPFIFFGSKKIKEINFSGAILESYYAGKQPLVNHEKFVTFAENQSAAIASSTFTQKLFDISSLDVENLDIKNLPKAIAKNSLIISYDKLAYKKQFEKINFEAFFDDEEVEVAGNFLSDNSLNNFKFTAEFDSKSKDPQTFLELDSPAIELKLKGNFTSKNNGFLLSDFNGEISAEIFDLKMFYKSYFGQENILAKKIKQNNKTIKINAKINNKEGQIDVGDLKLDSDLILGGGGLIIDVTGKIPIVDIKLDLKELDFDDMWSAELVSIVMPQFKQDKVLNEVVKFSDNASDNVDLSKINHIKNIDLTADIKIKKIKYFDGELTDFNLYAILSKDGEISILPMTFKTPDLANAWVGGVIDNNSIPPKFVGKINIEGKDFASFLKWMKLEMQNLKFENLKEYRIFSDVLLEPNKVAFDNLYLSLNSEKSEFLGDIKITNGAKISDVRGNFKAADFKVENYFLISNQSAYFSPGLLVKKMFWLNNLSFNGSFNIEFDRLVYKNEEFLNQNLAFDLGLGYFAIRDLHLKSLQTDAKVDLEININDNNPRFNLRAIANEFHYENMQDLQEENKDSPLIDKTLKVVSKNKNRNFIDQFYYLPSLEGFNGRVELDFEKIVLDGMAIKNAKLSGKLKDGIITTDEASGEIYGGTLSYKGLLGIKNNKIINGNIVLENIEVKPLLSNLFKLENISGISNISASISVAANKKEEFFDLANGEVKFSVNNPSVIGYGANDLVTKMFSPQSHVADLKNPENILFNRDATTVFDKASGVAQFSNGGNMIFKIDTSAVALNGILSGKINLKNNVTDSLFNVVFLTGNAQKQIPINIATNIGGDLGDVVCNTNLDQARQYLGLPLMVKKLEKSLLIQEEKNE